MKNSIQLAASLALITACGPVTEAGETPSATATATATEPAPAPAQASIGARKWAVEQVFDEGDDKLETVATANGKRIGTWKVKLGEATESITYGFIGSGGKHITVAQELLGMTEFELSVELKDLNAAELLEELEVMGAKAEDVAALEEGLTATDAVRYTIGITSDSGTSTSSGILPGATRDREVWSGSTRTVIGSIVGELGEPEVLAAEYWGSATGSRTTPEVSRAAGPVKDDAFEASFKIDGARRTFAASQDPQWALFLVAD
ncbi:MAG: hypothetical protein VX460_06945 [Planctomycetota bacterium]|nr:hypothetical protein [Planctomycetota bacterium]